MDTLETKEDKEVTYAEAAAIAADGRRVELAGKLLELRNKRDVTKANADKAAAKFERTIALLVSAKPERSDWYEHHGALDRETVRSASRLSTVALHRVMDRNRKRFPNPATGRGR